MPYPFVRADERPRSNDLRPTTGLRVTYPNNTVHWFPGPESQALATAKQICPEELLNHVGTTWEYGERSGTIFVMQKHLAGPVLSKLDKDGPQVITPSVV